MFRILAPVALAWVCGVARAAGPDAPKAPSAPITPLDAASAEAFADDVIEPAMAASGVPGAFIAIVRGDETVLVKGYGVADPATGVAVDPMTTQFNIASIGKPMTALAALSLAHEGALDLDRDVNDYLVSTGVQVTGGVLTLNHALGHRAGFDANLSHLFVDLGEDTSVSVAELNRRLVLLRAPGVVNAYDNQGYGVVGLVLTAVTGKDFARILEERVFAPIGMAHTRYVTSDAATPALARCTVALGPGVAKPCKYPVYREALRGAGGVGATAHDLARFLRVLLNRGRIDGRQVVPAELIADLTDFSRYRFHRGLPGSARSFTEFNHTDRPEYAHSGHVPGFSSMLRVYPAAGIGIATGFMGGVAPSFDAVPSALVAYALNYRARTPEVGKAVITLETLGDAFRDRFVPKIAPADGSAGTTAPAPSAPPVHRVATVAGRYVPVSEQSASLAGRIFRLVTAMDVTVAADGAVQFAGGSYRAVAADLYENAEGVRLAFGRTGDQVFMATGLSAAMWERKDALAAPTFTVPAFALSLLLWLTWLPYLWSRSTASRAAARLALPAWLVLVAGLLCELEYGVWLRIVKGNALVPLLWQSAIVVALVAMLVASARGLRAVAGPPARRRSVLALRTVHGVVLALAALALGGSWLLW